jgi:hypothetical protein
MMTDDKHSEDWTLVERFIVWCFCVPAGLGIAVRVFRLFAGL